MAEMTVARRRPGLGALRSRPPTPTLGLVALLLIAGALLLYAGRHLTFFFDEWDFVLGRRGGSLGTYLDSHNGHLVVFSVLVYKVLFKLVGLRHYAPYLAVTVVLHLLSCSLLYVLMRRRLGAWPALAPVALLLFMGSAYQDLLWPFQMSYLASVAGGLATLVLLDGGGRQRDLAAAVLLTWSVFSSGVGLAFVVAGAVMLIAQRQPWTRLWIAVVPLILFGIWYVGWASGEHITSDSILGAPQYDASAAGGAAAGITGLDQSWGAPLVVGLIAAVAYAWHRRADLAPTPMLLAAVLGALTFWTLAAVARSDLAEPTASRYLYVGAVFLILVVAESASGIASPYASGIASPYRSGIASPSGSGVLTRSGSGARLPGPWVALGLLLVLGALIANLRLLRDGERGLRWIDTNVRASLAVLDVAAPVVSPTFQPEPSGAPQITAGPYLVASRDLGSPALTLSELERSPASLRAHADGVLTRAERLAVLPSSGSIGGPCSQTQSGSGSVSIAVPPGGALSFQSPRGSRTSIFYRRFASTFGPSPDATLGGGGTAMISFPADRAPQLPWQVLLSSSGALRACVS